MNHQKNDVSREQLSGAPGKNHLRISSFFAGDARKRSHCPSLYRDFQPWFPGAEKHFARRILTLGRIGWWISPGRLMNWWSDSPKKILSCYQESTYGVSTLEYRNRTMWIWWNLLNYILLYVVCSSVFGRSPADLYLLKVDGRFYIQKIRDTSTDSTWCIWDSMGFLVGGLEHFSFFQIYRVIIPIDFHTFQRGGSTTNQLWDSHQHILKTTVLDPVTPWPIDIYIFIYIYIYTDIQIYVFDYRPTNRSFSLSTQHGQVKLSSDARRMLILRLWGWDGYITGIPRCNRRGWQRRWS